MSNFNKEQIVSVEDRGDCFYFCDQAGTGLVVPKGEEANEILALGLIKPTEELPTEPSGETDTPPDDNN